MSRKTTIFTVALMFLLAVAATFRIRAHRRSFDNMVSASLKVSAGYDQQFIKLVNRLERDLATRAQFGYQGGKDPMTGKTRTVVKRVAAKKDSTKKSKEPGVRLAAIVLDEGRKAYTAVVMLGERSFTVHAGDMVGDYKVTAIADNGIHLIKDGKKYFYDTKGGSTVK